MSASTKSGIDDNDQGDGNNGGERGVDATGLETNNVLREMLRLSQYSDGKETPVHKSID